MTFPIAPTMKHQTKLYKINTLKKIMLFVNCIFNEMLVLMTYVIFSSLD